MVQKKMASDQVSNKTLKLVIAVDAFIIHLERAPARLPQVERLCQQLPIATSIIPAVDGKSLTGQEKAHYKHHLMRPSYPFPLRLTEIAAFHSHRACWQAIIDQGLDAALILEDDVTLEEPFFSQAFSATLTNMIQGDVVRFAVKASERPRNILSPGPGPRIMVPRSIGLGMQAQIVTREAARILLEKTQKFDRPVDTYLQLRWHHSVRVLTVSPSGVREISAEMGGSLIGEHKEFLEIIFREVLRPIYRLNLFLCQLLKDLKG
jgi:glycosyl transferase family 25